MAGYIGSKAVNLSTTGADIAGDADVSGALDVGGAFTSQGIDDNATSTAMTLDASGSVGIGTDLPSRQLDIYGANPAMQFTDSDGSYGQIVTGAGTLTIRADEGNTVANSYIRMEVDGSEAMRLDASGNVLVGSTAPALSAKQTVESSTNCIAAKTTAAANTYEAFVGSRNGNSGKVATWWYNNSSQVGSISITASSTSYNTSSDYRLKTDAQPMTGASARVQALNPVNFEWVADGTRVDGFLAHEAQEVVPEAVTGTKDAMRDEEYEVTPAVLDEDGNVVTEAVMGTRSVPDHQGLDQSKLVPLLTAALQEALTKIDDMETRLAALEAV